MGRIIVEQIVTADGFASGPDGELDFMSIASGGDAEDDGQLELLAHVDAILLGRVTYELFEAYWPSRTETDEPVAGPINRLPKHVVTHTLAKAPWGQWSSAIVESGEPRDTARRLAAQYAGDIVVWGSLTLAGALLQAGLVDELRLRVVPALIGQGRPATTGLRHTRRLDLTDTVVLPGGRVTLAYDVL